MAAQGVPGALGFVLGEAKKPEQAQRRACGRVPRLLTQNNGSADELVTEKAREGGDGSPV